MKKPNVFEIIKTEINRLNKEYAQYLGTVDPLRESSGSLRSYQYINQIKALKALRTKLRRAGIK